MSDTNNERSSFSIELRFQLYRDIRGRFWLGHNKRLMYQWCGTKSTFDGAGWYVTEYKDWEHQADPTNLLSFLLETGEDARVSVRKLFTMRYKVRFY